MLPLFCGVMGHMLYSGLRLMDIFLLCYYQTQIFMLLSDKFLCNYLTQIFVLLSDTNFCVII